MKVLNVMTSRLDYNGIGIYLLNYYQNIDFKKIQMDFLVPNIVEEKLKNEITKYGNKIFELDYKGYKLRQKKPILYCMKLYKILKNEKYDIIHVHGSSSMMFLELLTAKLAGIKTRIAHSHNTKSDNMRLHRIFFKLFIKLYTDAFSCGQDAGEWLFGKNAQFTIIPNAKNIQDFEFNFSIREEIRRKYNLSDKIVLGHAGSFSYQKNHEYLIKVFYEIFKRNKNYYLILAGKGENQDNIKKQSKELGIEDNILFLDQISNTEMIKWLNAMDIMIFPSRFEGFPGVLIEWQIMGLPCIISDKITKYVKVTELVKFMSIEDSPDKWANEIINIELYDREKYKNIFKNQVCDAGYDIKKNAELLIELYLKLYKKNNI